MASICLLFLLLPLVSSTMVTLEAGVFDMFNNETVMKYTWKSSCGFSVSVISYGVIIQSIKVPDKNGSIADVNLGFDNLDGYIRNPGPYFGATLGRVANRIGGANFYIDGVQYHLAHNDGKNHLHGGVIAFDKVNWQSHAEGNKVTFSYISKDREEGYPGDLLASISVEVIGSSLHMTFQATTNKKTIVNLSNHAYFNLAGHDAGTEELYNHIVTLNANEIVETDVEQIPTGKLVQVRGTPFDLRAPTRIGDVIHKQNRLYDNTFCVSTWHDNGELNFAARVYHPSSRYLEVFTDQPGFQFYTSNNLPDKNQPPIIGKDFAEYVRHGAFCLETEKYPDAVHHDNFPSTYLSPGEVYKHRVVYKFGAVA